MRAPVEISISQQVWVCDACGCKDNKSCGCDSPAHAEELAAKKEAHRQAARASAQRKAKQNQSSFDNQRGVDNTEEFSTNDEDDETAQEEFERKVFRQNYRSAFLIRAHHALEFAVVPNEGKVDQELVDAARAVAAAWMSVAQKLEERCHGK